MLTYICLLTFFQHDHFSSVPIRGPSFSTSVQVCRPGADLAQGGHAFRKRAGARVRDQGWHVGVGRNPLTGWLPLLPFRLIIAGKTSQDQGSLLAKISFLYLHYIVNGYMIYIYNYIIIPPWFCIILPRDLYFAKISFLYLGCWELDGQVAETSK